MKLPVWSPTQSVSTIEKNLRSGSALLFGGFMLGNVLAYIYQMLLSRMLSPSDFGALVTLTSIFYVLAVFWRAAQAWVIDAVAGLGSATAAYPRAVFISAMRSLLPLGVVVIAIHVVASGWAADFLQLASPTSIVVLGLYVASSFLLPVAVGLPLGLSRLRLASGVIIAEPITRLAVGLPLIVLGLGLNGALAGFTAGNVVAFAITLFVLRRLLVDRRDPPPSAVHKRSMDRYALLTLVINACLMAIVSIDQVVVKHYFSDEVAGNYAVAFLLGRIISMSTINLAWVIFARSATMPLNDERRSGLFIKGLLATGAIALTLGGGFLVAPELAAHALSGSQYGLAASYVGLEGIEMILFSFSYVQVYYHISIRKLQVVWPLGLATILEIALLIQFHATIQQVLWDLILVMGGLLLSVSILSWKLLREADSRGTSVAVQSAQTVS